MHVTHDIRRRFRSQCHSARATDCAPRALMISATLSGVQFEKSDGLRRGNRGALRGAREMSIFAGDAFGNAPGMLFELDEDFAGAFSSSGKCSVMLVAGPRCGGPRSK